MIPIASLFLTAVTVATMAGAQEGEPVRIEVRLEYDATLFQQARGLYPKRLEALFACEPQASARTEYADREVRRGVLRFGNQSVPCAWDEEARVLYFDRDRDGNPSNDPPISAAPAHVRSRAQHYSGVEMMAAAGEGEGLWVLEIEIEEREQAAVRVVSGWGGEVEVDGEHYSIAVGDDGDGMFDDSGDRLALWQGAPDLLRAGLTDVPRRVVLGEHLYDLALRLEPSGQGGTVIATFSEEQAPTGSLEVTGQHITRLTLEQRAGHASSPTLDTYVALFPPADQCRLPAGTYRWRLELAQVPKLGQLVNEGFIEITAGECSVLAAGAPLHNSLEARRRGSSVLELEYHLRGSAGEEYELPRTIEPALVVSRNGRVVHEGQFRYG
ncbi:MAG: hypothetical protein AB1486_32215 [Planctomycetota bacterium]